MLLSLVMTCCFCYCGICWTRFSEYEIVLCICYSQNCYISPSFCYIKFLVWALLIALRWIFKYKFLLLNRYSLTGLYNELLILLLILDIMLSNKQKYQKCVVRRILLSTSPMSPDSFIIDQITVLNTLVSIHIKKLKKP